MTERIGGVDRRCESFAAQRHSPERCDTDQSGSLAHLAWLTGSVGQTGTAIQTGRFTVDPLRPFRECRKCLVVVHAISGTLSLPKNNKELNRKARFFS